MVAKLFGLVGASVAVFGRKDYQQLAILRRVASDLFMPIEIVGHPIVREADGLAMSSRNAYLSADERARALFLSRGLAAARNAFDGGERAAAKLEALTRAEGHARRGRPSTTSSVVDADTLQPFTQPIASKALIAIACRVGKTRLIDNTVLGETTS